MINNYDLFLEKASQIATYISSCSFIRIFSHNDADGIVSSFILMKSLERKKIRYQTTFLSKIDSDFFKKFKNDFETKTVVFLDMGSTHLSSLESFQDLVILDHHKYKKESKFCKYFLNSEDFDISGSFFACASSICYVVSKFLDSKNQDLSALALVGIYGDRQILDSINKVVLDDAIENNLVQKKSGYMLGDDYLYNIFLTTIEPYIDITGNLEKIRSFFSSFNIPNKKISDMSEDEIIILKEIIYKELIKYSCSESLSFLFGTSYSLKESIIKNIHDFSSMITCCGQNSKPSLGVALCFQDKSIIKDVDEIYLKTKLRLVNDLLNILNTKKELNFLYYFYGKNIVSAGEIASSLSRYRYSSKVIICFNETEFGVKVSGRCSIKLVEDGIDLSLALSKASIDVGGTGGGHAIASGGMIPIGKIENFILILDSIFEKQLNNKTIY